MFDEFVQNSARNPGHGGTSIAGPSRPGTDAAMGYQTAGGFEQEAGTETVTALETGFNSAEDPTASLSPIFQLGRVQYAFPAPLALLTVSSNILTMCLYAYPRGGILPQNLPPPPRLVRINLDEPERTEEAEVPLPPVPRNRAALPTDSSLLGPHKMFADPSGQHLILAMRTGDSYYWRSGWKRAKVLSKWKGTVVESIAWNKDATGTSSRRSTSTLYTSTKEILVGTKNGDIYEAVISAPIDGDEGEGDFIDRLARRTAGGGSLGPDIDKYFRLVFSLSERQPITGLLAVPFGTTAPSTSSSAPPTLRSKSGFNGPTSSTTSRAGVIATTNTRIYEFIGSLGSRQRRGDESDGSGEGLYARLFEAYKGSVPNLKSELPGNVPYSELRYLVSNEGKSPPKALAWLTAPGIYHGLLNVTSSQDVGGSIIESANLLPYPTSTSEQSANETTGAEIPVGIMLSEFHFVLLYQARAMAFSSLDDTVVFEESIPLKPNERVIGATVDTARKTYWIFTDANIFEVVVKDEDRNVWKIYMEKGLYEIALKHVKTPQQRDLVLSAQGDHFFKEGRHIQAAQCYAQSFTRTFEQVVLKFLDVSALDALRYYLVSRLERLKKIDVTQRSLLATWLVEIYLSKIDQLEDVAAAQAASQDVENYVLEQGLIDEELRQFFATYKDDLDPRTTFSLISRHGRTEMMMHYAAIIGEHEKIMRHWLGEGDWSKAIDTINRQSDLSLYYRFSTTLMRNAPTQTVDCWLRQPALDPRKLIPAMLQHRPQDGEPNEAVRYLKHVITEGGSTEPAVHNFLFTLLARGDRGQDPSEIDANLQHFIASSPTDPLTGDPYYDLDYALRTCAETKRQEASVRIYAKMGFFENAVDLALEGGDVDLACYCAESVDDQSLRRKLWLKTAKHVVETRKDIKAATEFLAQTSLLSIEDILPFFPDFTVIDSFKEEICLALEGYATKIEELKTEMETATQSAQNIKADIEQLSRRFVTIEEDDRCGACNAEVLSRQFYVFPCRHAFHADCLIRETTRRLPPRSLRRLLDLQTQLSNITSGVIPPLPSSSSHLDHIAAAPQTPTGGGGGMGGEVNGSAGVGGALSLPRRAGASVAAAASAAGGTLSAPLALGTLGPLGFDRLPETILAVLTAGVSVSVAGGRRVLAPLDPFNEPVLGYRPRNSNGGGGGGSGGGGGGGVVDSATTTTGTMDPSTSTRSTEDVSSTNQGLHQQQQPLHDPPSIQKTTLLTSNQRHHLQSIQTVRDEMDSLLAAACPLCAGSLLDLSRPFVLDSSSSSSFGYAGAGGVVQPVHTTTSSASAPAQVIGGPGGEGEVGLLPPPSHYSKPKLQQVQLVQQQQQMMMITNLERKEEQEWAL